MSSDGANLQLLPQTRVVSQADFMHSAHLDGRTMSQPTYKCLQGDSTSVCRNLEGKLKHRLIMCKNTACPT